MKLILQATFFAILLFVMANCAKDDIPMSSCISTNSHPRVKTKSLQFVIMSAIDALPDVIAFSDEGNIDNSYITTTDDTSHLLI